MIFEHYRLAWYSDIFHTNCMYNHHWHFFLHYYNANNQPNEYIWTHSPQTEIEVLKISAKKNETLILRSTFNWSIFVFLFSFVMFSLLLLVMSVSWLFLILSWIDYDGLLYAHIIVNSVQAPFILYICVLRQKHVKFLLKKTCCYNEPPSASDWGDEMSYMNGADYW